MYRRRMWVVLLSISMAPEASAQAPDSARLRAAYGAVTALRTDYERSHGHFVNVNGIRMHYLEWGDVRGTPLVWAHNSASSAYDIRAVAPRLAQAGYRVLAVDYRGHGQTHVDNYEFSVYDVADDLIGLLDSLHIPAAVFGGSSKGGFIAAAVYDQYRNRVLGLLMAEGGTFSTQWLYDHNAWVRDALTYDELPPPITGPSEFDVFRRIAGGQVPATGAIPTEALLNALMRIGPTSGGEWGFLPGFSQMVTTTELLATGPSRPSTFPLLQWSQMSMIPMVVFRRLSVPMTILDLQEPQDMLPVTDQNERLARAHPDLVVHKIYPDSHGPILQARPDWFVRDATELLDRVRQRKP